MPQPAAMLNQALDRGMLRPEDDAAILLDLDRLRLEVADLTRAFPENALHAVAVKANPVFEVLAFLARLGVGAEAASRPELLLALRAGFPPDRIVFDSPAKTVGEIALALDRGVRLNADSFQELERVAAAMGDGFPKAGAGLRINPQVGEGSVAATSVAGKRSKFGVPIEARQDVLAAFERHAWLDGLHVHVGSQGCSPDLLAAGVQAVYELALAVNERHPGRIRVLDIGGGLPARYLEEDREIAFGDYAALLQQRCPRLFSDAFRLVSEFGRRLHAGAGLAVSRVEYVKRQGQTNMAVIHLGADMFLRECYQPGVWPHRVFACDSRGIPKSGGLLSWDLAGPLCFSGDFPARGVALPELQPGDWVCFRDAGAYTFSMWSRYNSRPMPRIVGLDGFKLRVLKEREDEEAVVSFWT